MGKVTRGQGVVKDATKSRPYLIQLRGQGDKGDTIEGASWQVGTVTSGDAKLHRRRSLPIE